MKKIFFISFLFIASNAAAIPLTEIEKDALGGDAASQFQMCGFYYLGQGVPKNQLEAAKWCELAAKQGHVEAAYNLALQYQRGEGVGQNINEAKHWYKFAADHGHKNAQFNLFQIENANNPKPRIAAVPAQPVQIIPAQPAQTNTVTIIAEPPPVSVATPAKPQNIQPEKIPIQPKTHNFSGNEIKQKNCLQAAQKGIIADNCKPPSAKSQEDILPEEEFSDYVKALMKDAEAGKPAAQYKLGVLYRDGRNVPQDNTKALDLFSRAASHGKADAMAELGSLYKKSDMVDPEKSFTWYSLAADRLPAGKVKTDAVQNLKILSGQLSNEQISRAMNMASELDKKISLIKN